MCAGRGGSSLFAYDIRALFLPCTPDEKTYLPTCAPNGESDHHMRLQSLIRILTGPMLDSQGCKVSSCRQLKLIKLCRCAGWFESYLCTHVHRYVFFILGSNGFAFLFFDHCMILLPTLVIVEISSLKTPKQFELSIVIKFLGWSPINFCFVYLRISRFFSFVAIAAGSIKTSL